MSTRLYSDIKKTGNNSPFVLVAPQTFGLRELGAKPSPAKPSSSPKPSVKPKVKVSAKVYSFAEAAEKVLEQFSNKRPMHFGDITKKAREQGWLNTEGKTPEASMGAQIYTAIKRAQRRGEQPHFVQHGKCVFSLSKWMGHGLPYEIEQHNRQVLQALRKRLLGLKPKEFEDLIGLLLVVGDVIRIRMAIQAKKWKIGNNVQAQTSSVCAETWAPTTRSSSSPRATLAPARKEAERADATPVGLMSGEQLVTLLATHDIGIVRQSQSSIELDESAPETAVESEDSHGD